MVEDCAFVRALPENERPTNGRLKASYERVPLLFIPANPLVDLSGEPMRALDEESEWKEMSKHIIASNAGFDLLKMLPATPEQLQTVMAQFREGLIVHFSGHCGVEDGKALLLFERENGASNPLDVREFVREIKDKAAITFLSACQSAVAERTEFSNLARGLVKAGVPFALGMQFNLPDPFAPEISGQFYNYLTRGHGVPEAARQARRAVKREHEFFVGMIALYAAHPDEAGALRLSGAGAQTLSTFRPADVSDLPSPASGLIGRQRELMRIGTLLLEEKQPLTVTLHGAGGIGKTALLWQALLSFAPSFELTLAIALDPLPSLESVLGRIERFWGLPSPCSNDTKEREALVRNALMGKRTLLGLDNFETLNHAVQSQETLESKAVAKSLYAFFKSLPAAGVTLCVTSREKTNLPGEHIEEIYGLDDAMGGALLYENVSTRKDALNEAGLKKLSAAVGGHPLALRLLAPIFEEQAGLSLEAFIEKLQTFLPKASDQWSEQERHESLGACFAFSMDNLPKNEEGQKLQVALSRLSVFIAFFVDFTAAPVLENKMFETDEEVTAMRERANSALHALWERGLLERAIFPLEKENLYLFRLHPALRFFARERLSNIEIVEDNYWKSLSNFVRLTEKHIQENPLMAQIAWHAVPDLVTVAESKTDENAAIMQFKIGRLLEQFGLYDDALHLFERSRDTNQSLNNMQGKSATFYEIANIYVFRGQLDEAMTLYQECNELAESIGDKNTKSNALGGMAEILITRGNLKDAMVLCQQSLDIKEGIGDADGKGAVLCRMASIYATRNDLDSAIKLYEQALVIFEDLANLRGKGATLNQMANIYFLHNDFDEALKRYEQALSVFEAFGDPRGKTTTLHNIARIYDARDNFDEAMKLYQQVLEIDESLGNLESKSHTLHAMANVCFKRGDLDRAMKIYQQTLEINEILGDKLSKGTTLSMIGQVFWANGDHRKAIAHLFSGLTVLLQSMIYPQTQQAIGSDLIRLRKEIGTEEFDTLWQEEIGQPIPEWLTEEPDQEQGMPAELFIAEAIQAAREERPEAKHFFDATRKMSTDSSAPTWLQELGKVLQQIMMGDKNIDLLSIPPQLAEAVRKALENQ